MTPLETLTHHWADICDKIPGSFAPRVEPLPDDRILFSISCGARRGKGRVTVQLALDSETWITDTVARHVQEEVVRACPYSRRFL